MRNRQAQVQAVIRKAQKAAEFAAFRKDQNTIRKIIQRAWDFPIFERMTADKGISQVVFQIMVNAINARTKLRLEDWLNADDFNFLHDAYGIVVHFSTVTFQLENCFLPRFAK